MKRYLPSVKKAFIIFIAIAALLFIATELIYNRMETDAMNGSERAIIFFYRTNVPGGQANAWQLRLEEKHPEIKHLEVQCFDILEQSGTNAMGMPATTSGWQIISTRMAVGQCDILLLDRERYEFLLSKDYLLPLEAGLVPGREISADSGVMGYDISGMQLQGLEFPCKVEPHNRVESTSDSSSEVILCLLKDAKPMAAELAAEILRGATKLPEPEDITSTSK